MTDPHPLQRKRPSPEVRRKIDRMVQARGWCIGSYAQVEFIMADFALKASTLPGYESFGTPFPMGFSTRLKRVRDIAAADGGLRVYAPDLMALAKAIETWEDKRHTLVHGWLEIVPTSPRGILFRMRRFNPVKENDRNVVISEFTLAEIMDASHRLNLLADKSLMLFHDIYHQQGLEKHY